MSSELEIVLLIVGLYASTCVVPVYANEGVIRREFRRRFSSKLAPPIGIKVADDRIRIAGRLLIWLNPLTPMFPVFRGQWGNIKEISASPGLSSHVFERLRACELLMPYVFVVFACAIIGIPAALLLGNMALVLPVVAIAYVADLALMARIWFLRDSFALSSRNFAWLVFESVACLPLSPGVVRRLSLLKPIGEDLASYLTDMPSEPCLRTAESLAYRCAEIAGFYDDESPHRVRLLRYQRHLSSFIVTRAVTGVEADTVLLSRNTSTGDMPPWRQ